MTTDDRRSGFSTFVSLVYFATVAIGTWCILSLLVSAGPAIGDSWQRAGLALPLPSRMALVTSRLVRERYVPVLAMVGALHLLLLLFDLWAGRTPGRLQWGGILTSCLVAAQLITMLWLGIAFVLPSL